MSDDTLVKWWPLLAGTTASEVTDELYEWAAPVDRAELEAQYKKLDAALVMRVRSGKHAKEDQGAKSKAVGAAFEAMLRVLFNSSGSLRVKSNVRTTANEIDMLVTIDPSGVIIPVLRAIGTHFICEAKCHTKAPSATLVNGVVGFLELQSATFAILFVFCTSRALHRDARTAIAMHWMKGVSVVPMGRKQLEAIRKGAAFLRVLTDQHVEAANHITQLAV
jgi:hypothetical protein